MSLLSIKLCFNSIGLSSCCQWIFGQSLLYKFHEFFESGRGIIYPWKGYPYIHQLRRIQRQDCDAGALLFQNAQKQQSLGH